MEAVTDLNTTIVKVKRKTFPCFVNFFFYLNTTIVKVKPSKNQHFKKFLPYKFIDISSFFLFFSSDYLFYSFSHITAYTNLAGKK